MKQSIHALSHLLYKKKEKKKKNPHHNPVTNYIYRLSSYCGMLITQSVKHRISSLRCYLQSLQDANTIQDLQ